MTRGSIREYAEAMRQRYVVARKAERASLLDEFCRMTGYHRKSAVRLLWHQPPPGREGRGRKRQYGPAVADALKKIWEVSDHLCSKRLAPFLSDLVAALERHGEVALDDAVRAQVVHLSPATIDRLLRSERLRLGQRPATQGAAAASLRSQIPLRTFGDWVGVRPGAAQADLVMHCGETTDGFYLATLDVVDVATGWTDCDVIWGKGQERVGTAVHHVRQRLPFAFRELHTDNGGEFLNAVLHP